MLRGTLKFFNFERGYGFIKPDDGSDDVFVHEVVMEHSPDTIQANDDVVYEIGETRTGRIRATSIKLASDVRHTL